MQGAVHTKGDAAHVAFPSYTNLVAHGHFKFCESKTRFVVLSHLVQLVDISWQV